jgi:hypothetical protein
MEIGKSMFKRERERKGWDESGTRFTEGWKVRGRK